MPDGTSPVRPDPASALDRPGALVVGEILIDVVRGERHPGGSAANVALALGRLGSPVDLLTCLGRDEDGRLASDRLTASGVRLVPGSDRAPRTSVAVATLGPDGSAAYEFDLTWDPRPDAGWPADPYPYGVTHVGSLGALLAPGADRVHALLHRASDRSAVTYDPNLRPTLLGDPGDVLPRVERLVALADVVKASDEDLAWLLPDLTAEEVALRWLALGPSLVVLTRGARGASAFRSGGRVDVPPVSVAVADTVGAGDSFMAALIHGLTGAGLLGPDTRTALRAADPGTLRDVLTRCARVAAVTVSRPGADPPWRHELD